MKSAFILFLLSLSASSISAQALEQDTPTLASLAPTLAEDEIQVIYEKFLKEDLMKSPHCVDMKPACGILKQTLLAELKLSPRKWKRKFYLEQKEEIWGMMAGQFARAPKMAAHSPRSCTLILTAGWSIKNLWLVDGFIEFACAP
jgi:hypothetical protein